MSQPTNNQSTGIQGTFATFCLTPALNGITHILDTSPYQTWYRTDLDVGKGISYLLSTYSASNDLAKNAGLQAAIWNQKDGHAYVLSGGNALAANTWYAKFRDEAISKAAIGSTWTATTTTGFASGGLGGLDKSQGLSTVPELGTILAVFSILAPAGMLFRRRK